MIKKFVVPLIEKELVLYIGGESWSRYVKDTKAKGRESNPNEDESTPPPKDSGKAWGSWVYLDNIQELNTMIHEVLHFLDDIYDHVACNKEPEFKAWIGADILERVLLWREKELDVNGKGLLC